uniref:Variable lymphocyte receptor B cassette n=1 Tax=Petromyzon marinus TaxID=7757 RepID=S4RGP0_PETMA
HKTCFIDMLHLLNNQLKSLLPGVFDRL